MVVEPREKVRGEDGRKERRKSRKNSVCVQTGKVIFLGKRGWKRNEKEREKGGKKRTVFSDDKEGESFLKRRKRRRQNKGPLPFFLPRAPENNLLLKLNRPAFFSLSFGFDLVRPFNRVDREEEGGREERKILTLWESLSGKEEEGKGRQ